MLAFILIFSLSNFAAAVSAIAIPERQQQQGGFAKKQGGTGEATISTFSFGPSSTVYLGGGLAPGTTSSSKPVSGKPTTSPTESKTRSTASGTVAATGTIPTFSYFPSSTIPVSLRPTSRPSVGAGSGHQNGNGTGTSGGDAAGNKAGNGTAGGAGDGSSNDGSSNDGSSNDGSSNDGSSNDGSSNDGSSNDGQASERNNLADLLRGILDLLGN
ncbi:hypothetical protein F5X97DRAFT_328632 [Nemania serpens]|nr:hypothetical protein F5X97DRAFT_328632 [Nemania serpens]